MGDQVVFHTLLPESPAEFAKPAVPLPEELIQIMQDSGISGLYRHQAEAIDHIRAGRHTVIATPTASGKTLIYNLPILENILKNPASRTLCLFPLKALAQDQLRAFGEIADRIKGIRPSAAIYDGDTTAWQRKKIRENPPNVLLTNPEMLHLSFLPWHMQWSEFLSGLDLVVVDEVHTYRGLMGSHMANVFRRFLRICRFYGASPVFVFSSATVANPAELSRDLTGLNVETVTRSGAPRGRKYLLFMESLSGPARTAILLLKAALHRGLRSIVYAQSRKLTELIAIWAGSKSGAFAEKISAYRAGFLPEERREIEARLSDGSLLAVISTSALELGIDIGDLELCLLTGYPGTIVATWQRAGRVGRSGQDSAVILVAGEDALDQYFLRNPQELLTREPEAAVVNPFNPEIVKKHLLCAAAELPIRTDEKFLVPEPVRKAVAELEEKGDLLRSEDGKELYSRRKSPHRGVDLRGTGTRYAIICARTGKNMGDIDGFRAFRETHPGAVYLHNGETFLVNTLDPNTMTVKVTSARLAYYTRVRSVKTTEILEISEEKAVWGTRVFCGKLKVTDQVTGYEKRQMHGSRSIGIVPLDLPPQIFETEGIWFRIPREVRQNTETANRHFMGGIHAIEHAAIGIFPLLVMTDRNDLGGISTDFHPQVQDAAVFIYDGVPGGAGLTRQAYYKAGELLEATLKVIRDCPCESGCPSCVHSPKCGSGNRPIDKQAAVFILEQIRNRQPDGKVSGVRFQERKTNSSGEMDSDLSAEAKQGEVSGFRFQGKNAKSSADADQRELRNSSTSLYPNEIHEGRKHPFLYKGNETGETPPAALHEVPEKRNTLYAAYPESMRFGVLDIETRRSAQEVGGWHRADRMGISCAVLYDSEKDNFFDFMQEQVDELVSHMKNLDLIVGFNIRRFDYHVLKGHSDFDFASLPTLDILDDVHKKLGYRLSLDHLARITLGTQKSADGLQALKWWKEGKIEEIVRYCRKDVEVTRDLFLYGKKNGYLLFQNKAGGMVRIPVKWQDSAFTG
ncbi:MAG: DEAD/DEAH box helicase [Desulfococcaceae bacterium]